MHLPRSVFSQRQVDLLLWLLRVNNVDDVPSVKSIKQIEDRIQRLCGIRSIPYDGALGHRYYVNSLSDIIQQALGHRYYVNSLSDIIQQVRHTAETLMRSCLVIFEGDDESPCAPTVAVLPRRCWYETE
jgi:hypothetical protein